jgi:FG-GAP-like repeat
MERRYPPPRITRRSLLQGALLGTVSVGALSLEQCGGGLSEAPAGVSAAKVGPAASSNAPVITIVSPSLFMVLAAGEFTYKIFGSNFTPTSTVLIEGSAVSTFYQSANELWAQTIGAQFVTPGTYSVVVTDTTGRSNAAIFTVYSPDLGPQPFDAFAGFQMYPAGGGAVVVADIDGDGFGDVILTGPGDSIAILAGHADGTLGAMRLVNGATGAALAVGDITGHGGSDMIGMSPTINAFVPLLNDGKGNFTLAVPVAFVGSFPGPLVLADILSSGRNDLLAAVHDPDVLYLFPNLGGGNFGPAQVLANLGGGRSFVVGDFDGDGKPDIAYNAFDPVTGLGDLHLLINQGGGAFRDVSPAGLGNAGGLIVSGDFNGDGLPDLAVESTQGILQVFLNQGNLSFLPVTQSAALNGFNQLVVGDFDGDGILDMAGIGGVPDPGSVLFLWGDGSGVFAPQYIPGPVGFNLAAGDINGDGIPDVVVPDRALAVSVVLGSKGRNFPNPQSIYFDTAASIIAGDMNGDGLPDLFFQGDSLSQTPGTIFINQGNGVFQLAGRPPFQAQGFADLTGSGKPAMIAFDGVEIHIWPGTGDLDFRVAPISVQVPPPGLAGFLAADLDGDGLPELIAGGMIAWNKGNYQFDFVKMDFNGVFGIADVNRDGRLDLLTRSGTFLNQGGRIFTQINDNGLPLTSGDGLAIGDFDGDGILDAAISPIAEASFIVAKGRGDGTFFVQSALAVAENGTSVVVGGIVAADFLGVGRSQILAAFYPTPHFALFTDNGQGEFAVSYFASGASPPAGFAVADFNHDGRADVAILCPEFVFVPEPTAVIVFAKQK